MLSIFTKLADLIIYQWFGMSPDSHLAGSLHFFIEDTTKIFALLVVMIYVIAWARAALNIERVRDYLGGKHRLFGYVAAASFGAVTPFCSCSSIPLFLGFTQARIPIGITMAFLITSPIINEVAIVLLGSLLGVKFTVCYVTVGILAGVVGGGFIDLIGAEKYLTPLAESVNRTHPEQRDNSAPYQNDPARPSRICQRRTENHFQPGLEMGVSRRWVGCGAARPGAGKLRS